MSLAGIYCKVSFANNVLLIYRNEFSIPVNIPLDRTVKVIQAILSVNAKSIVSNQTIVHITIFTVAIYYVLLHSYEIRTCSSKYRGCLKKSKNYTGHGFQISFMVLKKR